MNGATRLDRRELGIRALRWLSLALLAGGGAYLWKRNGTTDPCPLANPCSACAQREGCTLERATLERPQRSAP